MSIKLFKGEKMIKPISFTGYEKITVTREAHDYQTTTSKDRTYIDKALAIKLEDIKKVDHKNRHTYADLVLINGTNIHTTPEALLFDSIESKRIGERKTNNLVDTTVKTEWVATSRQSKELAPELKKVNAYLLGLVQQFKCALKKVK